MTGLTPVVAAAALEGSGLEALGTVYTQLTAWMGTMVTTISNTPLLLIPVGLFVAGGVIGLCKRFIGR